MYAFKNRLAPFWCQMVSKSLHDCRSTELHLFLLSLVLFYQEITFKFFCLNDLFYKISCGYMMSEKHINCLVIKGVHCHGMHSLLLPFNWGTVLIQCPGIRQSKLFILEPPVIELQ